MSLLNGASDSINSVSATIKNPFTKKVSNSIRPDDFIDGFQFEELEGNKTKIQLNGNLMPHVPFKFGGEQRIVKEYYSGQTEPSVQILGPKESDLPISGRFYDKKYNDDDLYGVATEIQQLCDSVRIRGSLLRIWMGEFERYGFLKECMFELKNIGDISYTMVFDIVGFNAPINGKFIEKKKEVPFAINNELIALANELQNLDNIPTSVPQSVADVIGDLTNTVASSIALVTDFVDTVISTTNDIQKSTQRALGLIRHVQNKVREYKNFLGGLDPFDTDQALTGRYQNASFYANRFNHASFMTSFLQRFRSQFINLTETLPLGRHLVKDGDSLQKIATKFYQDATQWKLIYDHNNLTSTEIEIGSLLEIPRL